MSCYLSNIRSGYTPGGGWSLQTDITSLINSMREHISSTEPTLFEVFELAYWRENILSGPTDPGSRPEPLQLYRPNVLKAFSIAQRLGICQNRLWNLAPISRRGQNDLPALMRIVENSSQAYSYGKLEERLDTQVNIPRSTWSNSASNNRLHPVSSHDACVADFCQFSSIDSTRVKQLHKCKTKECNEFLEFPSSGFEQPYERFTWWLDIGNTNKKTPYLTQGKYIAISHVWSDGTGAGVQSTGLVNRCLFEFFVNIAQAKDLDCRAVWWDIISIPREQKARAKAISRMHENFKQAEHTVVHDQYLLQFPWTNDSSPCLALLLSPWFTRGWTALELMQSKTDKVWVLYRHPTDPNNYVLKNLSTDILARDPTSSDLGHWIATSILWRLQEDETLDVDRILRLLSTRSTSWSPDRMVIAGLLTGHEPRIDSINLEVNLTREILLNAVEVEESFLHHGHVTIAQKGRF